MSPSQLRSAINGAEIIIGNDYEISLIVKKTGWTIQSILDKVNILIITKGEKGSEIWQKNHKVIKIKAKKEYGQYMKTRDPLLFFWVGVLLRFLLTVFIRSNLNKKQEVIQLVQKRTKELEIALKKEEKEQEKKIDALKAFAEEKKKLEVAQGDIERSYLELKVMNKRLKELDGVKDEFVSNVSHELRTPLAIIRESISQIRDGLFGKIPEKQFRKQIHENSGEWT